MPAPTGTNIELIAQYTVPTTGGSSKTIINNYHYVNTGTLGSTKAQIYTAWNAGPGAAVAARLSIAATAQQVTIRHIDDATDIPLVVGTGTSGTLALPRLSTAMAVNMYFKTGQRGKSYRGFKHFGPLAAADTLNDELTAAGVIAWGTLLTALLANVVPAGGAILNPSIFSRKLSQALVNPTTIINTAIQSGRVDKTLGTMKHRKEKTNF